MSAAFLPDHIESTMCLIRSHVRHPCRPHGMGHPRLSGILRKPSSCGARRVAHARALDDSCAQPLSFQQYLSTPLRIPSPSIRQFAATGRVGWSLALCTSTQGCMVQALDSCPQPEVASHVRSIIVIHMKQQHRVQYHSLEGSTRPY